MNRSEELQDFIRLVREDIIEKLYSSYDNKEEPVDVVDDLIKHSELKGRTDMEEEMTIKGFRAFAEVWAKAEAKGKELREAEILKLLDKILKDVADIDDYSEAKYFVLADKLSRLRKGIKGGAE